jgi:phosphatidylglycerophosphatase A
MKWSADPKILRNPVHFLAFGFGAGLSPRAPGTAGTLVAVPLVWAMLYLDWRVQLACVITAFVVGVFLCGASARQLDAHDHAGIVWDEITGFAITMIGMQPTWPLMCAGFLLFRFFDVVKPWPIREADHRLSGGLGIMLDDVLAGLFSWAILYAAKLLT